MSAHRQISKFEASLVYRMRFRTVRARQRNPVSMGAGVRLLVLNLLQPLNIDSVFNYLTFSGVVAFAFSSRPV